MNNCNSCRKKFCCINYENHCFHIDEDEDVKEMNIGKDVEDKMIQTTDRDTAFTEIYYLRNIAMKGNEHGQLRPDTIYAELIHADGTLAISATLEYILSSIRDLDLAVEGVTVLKNVQRGTKCSEVVLDKYKRRSNG